VYRYRSHQPDFIIFRRHWKGKYYSYLIEIQETQKIRFDLTSFLITQDTVKTYRNKSKHKQTNKQTNKQTKIHTVEEKYTVTRRWKIDFESVDRDSNDRSRQVEGGGRVGIEKEEQRENKNS